jgi:hypothetical protein
MFENVGIDALSALFLIYATLAASALSAVVHMVLQLMIRDDHLAWREALGSSIAIASVVGVLSLLPALFQWRSDIVGAAVVTFVLALAGISSGALLGRGSGWLLKRLIRLI